MGNAFLVGQSKAADPGDMLLQVGGALHIPFTLAASAGTVSWAYVAGAPGHYDITNSNTTNITITSTSKIDLSRFSVLRYGSRMQPDGTPVFGFDTTNTYDIADANWDAPIDPIGNGGLDGSGSLDISALNGEYYFKFCVAGLNPAASPKYGFYYLILEV